jgi:hypothetical protein
MTAAIFQIVITCIFAAAAPANYVVLLRIDLKISLLDGSIREWSRKIFAEKEHVNSVQAHLVAVDARVRELERFHR